MFKRNRRWGSRGGNAMVEFAIGAGILTSVFTGTFSYGYTFYRYNTLLGAVSAGARYASMRPYDSTTTTPKVSFRDAVRNVVVYGNPSGGSSPVVPGLTTSNVTLEVGFNDGVPSTMTVYVTGYSFSTIFGTTTLTNKPRVRYAYQGLYSPYAATLP